MRWFSPCFRSNFASVHSPLSISVESFALFTCSTILDCSIMQIEVIFDSRFYRTDWFVSRISRVLFVFIIFFLFIVLYTKHNDQPVDRRSTLFFHTGSCGHASARKRSFDDIVALRVCRFVMYRPIHSSSVYTGALSCRQNSRFILWIEQIFTGFLFFKAYDSVKLKT